MKRIPIGISDFKNLRDSDCLFIDKSLLIKEFWYIQGETILLPRPRRFGKTLNMSMIRYFFDNNRGNNKSLFEGLNIEKDEEIMKLQGKIPVIYLSFKDEKHSSFDGFIEGIKELMSSLYIDHKYCLNNEELFDIEKAYYNNEGKIKINDYNEMNVVIENLNSYFGDMYGKYGDIDEEVNKMVKTFYDPNVEKKGIEKGIEKSIENQRLKDIERVKKLLTKKFGNIEDELSLRIDKADIEVLGVIIENILDVETIEEVEKLLK